MLFFKGDCQDLLRILDSSIWTSPPTASWWMGPVRSTFLNFVVHPAPMIQDPRINPKAGPPNKSKPPKSMGCLWKRLVIWKADVFLLISLLFQHIFELLFFINQFHLILAGCCFFKHEYMSWLDHSSPTPKFLPPWVILGPIYLTKANLFILLSGHHLPEVFHRQTQLGEIWMAT